MEKKFLYEIFKILQSIDHNTHPKFNLQLDQNIVTTNHGGH